MYTHPAHEEFPQINGSPWRMYHAPEQTNKIEKTVGSDFSDLSINYILKLFTI